MIAFLKARVKDASTLAEVSTRAFHSDINYGADQVGGPPGYDSGPWQARMMRIGDYYKIVRDARIIGGILVHRQGVREYALGRIFIEPEFQSSSKGSILWPNVGRRRLRSGMLAIATSTRSWGLSRSGWPPWESMSRAWFCTSSECLAQPPAGRSDQEEPDGTA
jgi:hypothetical protein